ncbi:MAG: OadG family transporter subunit [Bacteroidia bacterium]|nr:OadG family transporter subunit [Bacteroidia bacterium]
MENLDEALSLLLVGMITVFIILSLVVFIGNMVVRFTNRFIPQESLAVKKDIVAGKTKPLSPAKIAAVIAAVEAVTGGRGKIEKIDKTEK